MRVSRFLGWVALAGGLALGGCAHAFRQPEVTLTGLQLAGIGLKGGLVYADVAVRNPNGYKLEADKITYDLRVQDPSNPSNWLPFTAGTFEQDVKLESGKTTEIQVPIQFSFGTATAAVQSIMNNGIFNYQVVGDVHVKEPVTHTFPYRHQGVVTMAGAR